MRPINQPLIVSNGTGAKPVGQQAVPNLSDNKLSKPVGQQAVFNQPLIVSNGTGANQPPPN